MIILKKKTIFQELALSLYLMLEFDTDTTALSVIRRIRDRARSALEAAAFYTGVITEKDVHDFLKSKPLKFTIPCAVDIVKGDTIRFMEIVFDNRHKPPRQIGKRGITAEVIDTHVYGDDTMLRMRVIISGGVWDIKCDTEICRPLKTVTRLEVMRIAWDDEGKRQEIKNRQKLHPETVRSTHEEVFTPAMLPASDKYFR